MPTRTPATDAKYRDRARQYEASASRAAGRKLSPIEVASHLMTRTDLAYDSFRQNRASLVAVWEEIANLSPENASECRAAIKLMYAPREKLKPEPKRQLRTSQCKQKGIEDELDRICYAALATKSPNRQSLVAYLQAGTLAGARFTEWPTANFGPAQVTGFKFQLTFANGKQGNGRAHGERRTLLWEDLPADQVRFLTMWIETSAKAAQEGRYETLHDTLGDFMLRVTKKLFRKDKQRRPTLSSVRDAAVARWKQTYVKEAETEEAKQLGRAVVAALMGHASDESATKHYARARKGGGKYPTPRADPAEVASVLRRYSTPHFAGDDPAPPPL